MRELLRKINEYGSDKTGGTLSLVIERDESGFLIENVFNLLTTKTVFEFNTLKELYKEIGLAPLNEK